MRVASDISNSWQQRQRGVTILLVVIALVALLGMAALAIDVITLYVARTEAQRAADAAALAGAKAFVTTGFTSSAGMAAPPDPNDICLSVAGTGGTGAANLQAQAAAAQNLIAGTPATVLSINCNLTQPRNPQITVAVQRTNLPTFFARIWGSRSNSVRASATAEAFNPSGLSTPVSVAFLKPFLIPNCNPATELPPCSPGGFFISTSDNSINAGTYIGTPYLFHPASDSTATAGRYYVVNLPQATVCPGTSASCASVGGGGLYDNIACANVFQTTCGGTVATVQVNPSDWDPTALIPNVIGGTQCLIHAAPGTPFQACASPNPNQQDCFLSGPPVTINGGDNNPNAAFRPPLPTAVNISRSDSVITVPVYDGLTSLCTGSSCTSAPQTVIGFLQLGVDYIEDSGPDIGTIHAMVLNVAGCNPSSSGTPVLGGGVSPIPVRLIHN